MKTINILTDDEVNFVYAMDSCTSEMIEAFKIIAIIGICIFIIGASATFVFNFLWAFDEIKGKTVLIAISIIFTGIIISAIGIGNLNRNIKTAIENDYPDAVITDMTVENKTLCGTFQANKAEYCYKIENNQLRIQRRN
ncbi:hypothetical protein [Lachnospira eligens]|jgi:hypothetical protein|uniref:hypothetical protein n=1 Tax=Lachnospira eligens TaxID=39485 RepID=UPI000E521411|nr:hypothetical protein [Lachnospira eligens]RHK52086.1 hypothetical protein DW057_10915 [Lachnospira eligens]RHK83558.1 hypothetical protein DW044_12785 [Lachnospira eligens]